MNPLENYLKELSEKYAESVEELTREQFEDVLLGLIKSGDIARHVDLTEKNPKQGLTYLPYRRVFEQEQIIKDLKIQIEIIMGI